jgi:phosphoglycerol transferase MdoB-like AlkP superfamily enzyme
MHLGYDLNLQAVRVCCKTLVPTDANSHWVDRLFPIFRKIPNWSRQHWRAFLPLLTVFALPNLIFALLRFVLPVRRAWISIDYLALSFLVCWFRGRKLYIAVVAILLYCADAICSFSEIYYFDFGTALRYLKDLRQVSPWLTAPMALALLAVACAIAWMGCAADMRKESRHASLLLGAASVLLVPIWLARGVLTDSWTKQGPEVLVGSSLATEIKESMALFNPLQSRQKTQSAAYSAAPALAYGDGSSPQNVLIILEEALGGLKNAADQDAVLAPLESPEVKARYTFRRGSVAFFGGTVGGEMRELCDTSLGPGDSTPDTLRDCLPWKFRKLGYHTIGVHGFTKKMFDRQSWYPQIGIQELIFREELAAKLKGICGSAFAGNCDTEVASYIGDLIAARRNQRLFIHWMTLTAHLPVDDKTAASSQFPCENFDFTRRYHEVCNVIRVQFETNQAIAKLVLRPDLPPMTVIIAGDHAPPFMTNPLRALYQQDKVPYIILEPKPTASTPPNVTAHATPAKPVQPPKVN